MPAKQKTVNILGTLDGGDALRILKALHGESAALASKIERLALDRLRRVDREDVAALVYLGLDALDVHVAWERAGRSYDGYKEPEEAIMEMMEATLEPYQKDMRKRQINALWDAAMDYCLGILLGIRHFEEESATEFRSWAGDVPGEMFTRVLAEFRKGQLDKPSREKFDAYLDEYL